MYLLNQTQVVLVVPIEGQFISNRAKVSVITNNIGEFAKQYYESKVPQITIEKGINWTKALIIFGGTLLLGIGLCMLTPYIGGGVAAAATFIGFGTRVAAVGAVIGNSALALNVVRACTTVIGAVLSFFGVCKILEKAQGNLKHTYTTSNFCTQIPTKDVYSRVIEAYDKLNFAERVFTREIKVDYKNLKGEIIRTDFYHHSNF